MKKLAFGLAAACAAAAFGNVWDGVLVKGATDKANPVDYAAGEAIVFRLSAENVDPSVNLADYVFQWTRTGDDGKVEKGESAFAPGVFATVTTKMDIPGFVRLEGYLREKATGQVVRRDKPAPGSPGWSPAKEVFFDGGAGVDVARIGQEKPEPADFDAWWAQQKKILADVEMKAERRIVKNANGCAIYALTVACAGPRPVTGYLFIPEGAAPKSCGARVAFQGYGFYRQACPEWASWSCAAKREIFLEINAHGYELDREPEYYKEFEKGIRTPKYGYAFSPEENAKPETAYFRNMAFRVMRALQYVKSLPEWNGRSLVAEGGSQGGLQTSWAAGLDPDVTLARPSITWGCDFAMTSGARQRLKGPWYIPYAPGLDYFDSINHIRRAKCPVEITRAGLGDYTCPPSGLAAYYNAISAPKSILWVQGSRHGYIPPDPNQKFLVSAGHVQTGAESKSQNASADVKSN